MQPSPPMPDGYHHPAASSPTPPPPPPPLYPMPPLPPSAPPQPQPQPIDVSGGAITTAGAATPVQFHYPPCAPIHHAHRPQSPAPWSTGLCDCCDDVGNCCVTFLCPCITFGQIAHIVDQGSTSCAISATLYLLLSWVTGFGCLFSCFYRSKMRGQFFLEESPCADCLVHCCCEPCALCQEYRELRCRGFDPDRGWQGSGQVPNAMMLPPVTEGMRR